MKKTSSTTKYNFDFMGNFKLFGGLSVLLFVIGVIAIPIKGIQYGIDFAGGTEMEIRFAQPIEATALRKFVDNLGFKNAQLQSFGGTNDYAIRFENAEAPTEKEVNELNKKNIERVTQALRSTFASQSPEIRRVDSVGPQVGSQLKRNSMLAAFYALLLILIYVGMRFDYKYAPGAVLCLFHDAILTLAVVVVVGREVNVQVLAAILTLIGYSLNDTIVTFDRIRENEGTSTGETFVQLVNRSVNETLSRTVITTFMTFLSVISLYLFAKGAIVDFAFAMMVGMLFGVYSTIFVASPLVILYERHFLKKAV
jgi:preprotein translocase subunit SecF